MAWSEVTAQRNRHSRTYNEGALYRWSGSMAPLHYESVLDSGDYDTVIDCTPVRINNAQLDGWRVTANGWQYALGQPGDKVTDGWVGFGGRQGAHWLRFRLVRFAYWHASSGLDDIGGAPDYDRSNLSNAVHTRTIGPNNDAINVASVAEWRRLWAIGADEAVWCRWRVRGQDLKEEVILTQAARDWLASSRPPSTTPSETWLGMVFSIDWSDIPRVYRNTILQDIDTDFDDDDGALDIELRDTSDRLLAFMPVGKAYVKTAEGRVEVGLRRRFYKQNGSYYLLLGAPVPDLNGLPAGDIIFDPTVNEDVISDNDNCVELDDTTISVWYGSIGNSTTIRDYGVRLQGVSIPKDATVDTATLTIYSETTHSATVSAIVKGFDEDDTGQFSSSDKPSDRTKTTATVSWSMPSSMTADTGYSPGDVKSIIEEIVARAGWVSGNDLGLVVEDNGSSSSNRYLIHVYDSGYPAELDVTYSTGTVHEAQVTIAAQSTVAADAAVEREVAAQIDAESAMTVDAAVNRAVAAQIDAQSTLTANTEVDRAAAVQIAAQSAVAAIATVDYSAAAQIDAVSAMTVDAGVEREVATQIDATSVMTVTATVERSVYASCTIAAQSTVAVDAGVEREVAAAITVSSAVDVDAAVEYEVATAITASSVVVVDASVIRAVAAQIDAQSVLTAYAGVDRAAAVQIAAQSAVAAIATVDRFAAVQIDAVSTMSVSARYVAAASLVIAATSSLIITPTVLRAVIDLVLASAAAGGVGVSASAAAGAALVVSAAGDAVPDVDSAGGVAPVVDAASGVSLEVM